MLLLLILLLLPLSVTLADAAAAMAVTCLPFEWTSLKWHTATLRLVCPMSTDKISLNCVYTTSPPRAYLTTWKASRAWQSKLEIRKTVYISVELSLSYSFNNHLWFRAQYGARFALLLFLLTIFFPAQFLFLFCSFFCHVHPLCLPKCLFSTMCVTALAVRFVCSLEKKLQRSRKNEEWVVARVPLLHTYDSFHLL